MLSIDMPARCPVCNGRGLLVRWVTVRHLVRQDRKDNIPEEGYHLCLNAECDVVYFGPAILYEDDVKVRVWFKERDESRPICYCKRVTEAEILAHIRSGCCDSLEDIQNHTGANTGKECVAKNPAGR